VNTGDPPPVAATRPPGDPPHPGADATGTQARHTERRSICVRSATTDGQACESRPPVWSAPAASAMMTT
jgi:hypothetical protein